MSNPVILDTDKVVTLMVMQNLNQKELAAKAALCNATLVALLKNGRCRYKTAVKLAIALNVDVNEIAVRQVLGANLLRLNSSNIKIILAEQQKNISDLARECGVSRQCIHAKLIRGTCEPEAAVKLAKVLCVPIREIIKEE